MMYSARSHDARHVQAMCQLPCSSAKPPLNTSSTPRLTLRCPPPHRQAQATSLPKMWVPPRTRIVECVVALVALVASVALVALVALVGVEWKGVGAGRGEVGGAVVCASISGVFVLVGAVMRTILWHALVGQFALFLAYVVISANTVSNCTKARRGRAPHALPAGMQDACACLP